ncbi:MAG: histidine phosphatase family protein [Desulfovibrio sp.]|nr:histidine phosphatase family protein [Desulfovibrio sp.]
MRHGRTEWNEEGRLQGHMDSPLLPESLDLIRAMAEFFRDKKIGEIHASPLRRCSATADIVSGVLGLPYARDARLMEGAHGLCDGMLLSDTRTAYPDYHARWEKDRWNTAWPGGESYRDVFLRAQSFVADLNLRRPPGDADLQAKIPDHADFRTETQRPAAGPASPRNGMSRPQTAQSDRRFPASESLFFNADGSTITDSEDANPRAGSDRTGADRDGCLIIAHAQVNMCLIGALLSLTAAEILDLRQKNGIIYIASENRLRTVEFA